MNLFSYRDILYSKDPFVWAFIPDTPDRESFLTDTGYDNYLYKYELATTFRALNLPWVWQPLNFRNLPGIVNQVSACVACQETLVLNLCDGTETDGWMGVSVIELLQARQIPFTGADVYFYTATTSKTTMKQHFLNAGVPTPRFAALPRAGRIQGICDHLQPPLIVKPDISAHSYGIFQRSVVDNDRDLETIRDELVQGAFSQFYADVEVFVEAFVEGPEFTVFLVGDWDRPNDMIILPPIQRVFFDDAMPANRRFLYCDAYWEADKQANSPDPYYAELVTGDLKTALTELACLAYCAVKGIGYGRVDIRMDPQGALYVLEVNSNCGLSRDVEQSSVGRILELSGYSFVDLIGEILCQPLRRSHAARRNDGK